MPVASLGCESSERDEGSGSFEGVTPWLRLLVIGYWLLANRNPTAKPETPGPRIRPVFLRAEHSADGWPSRETPWTISCPISSSVQSSRPLAAGRSRRGTARKLTTQRFNNRTVTDTWLSATVLFFRVANSQPPTTKSRDSIRRVILASGRFSYSRSQTTWVMIQASPIPANWKVARCRVWTRLPTLGSRL